MSDLPKPEKALFRVHAVVSGMPTSGQYIVWKILALQTTGILFFTSDKDGRFVLLAIDDAVLCGWNDVEEYCTVCRGVTPTAQSS